MNKLLRLQGRFPSRMHRATFLKQVSIDYIGCRRKSECYKMSHKNQDNNKTLCSLFSVGCYVHPDNSFVRAEANMRTQIMEKERQFTQSIY